MKKSSLSVSEFKAKSLGLFERVVQNRETFLITKRGKVIAQVIPIADDSTLRQPGKLRSALISEDDIVSPFGSELWKAAENE